MTSTTPTAQAPAAPHTAIPAVVPEALGVFVIVEGPRGELTVHAPCSIPTDGPDHVRTVGVLRAAATLIATRYDVDAEDALAAYLAEHGILCDRCEGCGLIANTPDGEPWSAWAALGPGAGLAVRLGHVKPITCPDCSGAGTTVPRG